ncbi:AI-2E family transporter [Candidatus Saccharibacteria bacterium]|nr:AI-2E family transporter [Candidatus Saccharibacteria bacterium]MBR6122815.1 AI-2E family transporter [Candidatus Saccharibacteria bacterium]
MSRQIVEIETKTFIRFWLVIIGFAVLAFFVIRASEALAIIGIAALLAIAIRPLALKVDRLIGKKTQSRLASVLAYVIVLLVIAGIVAAIAPVIVTEFAKFLSTLPETVKHADLSGLNDIGRSFGIENLSSEIVKSIDELSHNLLNSLGTGVISGLTTVGGIVGKALITLVLTLFFLLDGPQLVNSLWDALGARSSRAITEARIIVKKMTNVISTFFSKQVLIALLDGTVTALSVFALLLIFGVEARLALPMGLITMVCYLIPMFGQVIGAALVTLILAFNNPIVAIIWLAFYIIYGFVEVNVFAPKFQGNALKLRPVVILMAMVIGTYTFGLLGAIVAIPIAGCIKVLIEEYPTIRKLRS